MIGEMHEERRILDRVRRMNLSELRQFAQEIRSYIIDVVSKNGGHLASNLGTVELTLALYRVFDPFEDIIIWDTGHQAYTHKLLTGRWERFPSLRRLGGLSGFTNIFESPYDRFGAGHVGTSIAAALGIEKALSLRGEMRNVVVVIGDGALTSGQALEALNQVKAQNSRIKIILNSNGMSISRNVGGLAVLLESLRTSKMYNKIKSVLKRGLGEAAETELKKIREAIKVALVGEDFFEALGLKHFGPVDGHDIQILEQAIRGIKDYPYPTVLTVFTVKGKGYEYSEGDPSRFHGVEKFDPETGSFERPPGSVSYSEVFGRVLTKAAAEDRSIVAITAAMPDGTGLSQFARTFPERFVDLGITEQSVVTYAGALALQGFKPVVAIYSTFLQRAYDQIVHDVALQKAKVVFAVDRAGLVGSDGPTHHGVFDIAYLKSVPNMVLLTPIDARDLSSMLLSVLNLLGQFDGPVAIRYPRDTEVADVDEICGKINLEDPFAWKILNEGRDVCILAVGTLARKYESVSRMNHWTLVGVRSVKPFDSQLLNELIRSHNVLVTVEEGVLSGGFGESVNTYVLNASRKGDVRVLNLGIPDEFVTHGTRGELLELVGLSPPIVEKRVTLFLRGKQRSYRTGKGWQGEVPNRIRRD